MKKVAYIILFTFLGLLLSLLVHALVEMAALSLILSNYERYSLSPLWLHWEAIHTTFTFLLTIIGLTVGFLSGRHFWPMLYNDDSTLREKISYNPH